MLTILDSEIFSEFWDAFCRDEDIPLYGRFNFLLELIQNGVPLINLQERLLDIYLVIQMDRDHISITISHPEHRRATLTYHVEADPVIIIDGRRTKVRQLVSKYKNSGKIVFG